MCASLGIPLAPDKVEGPTTCLTFLGIKIDTVAMELPLPDSDDEKVPNLPTVPAINDVNLALVQFSEIISLGQKLDFTMPWGKCSFELLVSMPTFAVQTHTNIGTCFVKHFERTYPVWSTLPEMVTRFKILVQ